MDVSSRESAHLTSVGRRRTVAGSAGAEAEAAAVLGHEGQLNAEVVADVDSVVF